MQLISCSVKGGAWKCCKKLKVQRLGKYCRQDSINALNFSRGHWRILKNYQDKGWHFCMHILPDDAHIGGLEYGATSGKHQNFHWFMLLDFFYWLFNMFLLFISSFVLINWCVFFNGTIFEWRLSTKILQKPPSRQSVLSLLTRRWNWTVFLEIWKTLIKR